MNRTEEIINRELQDISKELKSLKVNWRNPGRVIELENRRTELRKELKRLQEGK